MQFQLLPVVDAMLRIYQMPRDFDRFKAYIKLLTGNTDNDVDLPIGYFNPMAKEHVIARLQELKDMGIENIMNDELQNINKANAYLPYGTFKVVMALADDLHGGWTNRFTTDYDSKFKSGAISKRQFCNVLFWVSEDIDEQSIRQRTAAYCYRTIYHLTHTKAETLAHHIAQEKFVNQYAPSGESLDKQELKEVEKLYHLHQHTEAYPIIFNFLYGDGAAAQLGYVPVGIIPAMAGFKFAALQ